MKNISITIFLMLLISLCMPIAQAANMFLSFPDSDIVGESQDDSHGDEIEVLSWSWALETKSGKKASTKVIVEDMSITKLVDSATSSLVMAALLGQNLGRAVLTVRKPTEAGDRAGLDYIVLTMNNVTVSSYQTGGKGGDQNLDESLGLQFSSITGVYVPQGKDGSTGSPIDISWDLQSNKRK